MANKKVSQLTSKPSVLTTDIVPIADPSTGQLFKTTLSSLGAVIGSAVASVNGLVGVVVLDTDDIQELASPTNKWFTDTRARAALSAGTGISYNSGTGVITNAVTSGQITTALGYTPANDSLVVKLSGNQTISGNLTATSFIKAGGTSSQFLMADGSVSTTIAFNYPGAGIVTSTGSAWGTSITDNSTNWNTAYSSRISSLTTSGDSGSATLVSNVLNIPTYTLSGLGGQPALSGTGFVKISGTTISYDNSTYLTTSSASSTYLTIANAAAQYQPIGTYVTGSGESSRLGRWTSTSNLSVAQIWDDGTNIGIGQAPGAFKLDVTGTLRVTGAATFSSSVTASSFAIPSGSSSGFLKANGSVDLNTYLTTTSAAAQYQPIGTYVAGSGSSSRLARWISSSDLSVAQIWDDGTNVGIGQAPGSFKLDVTGTGRFTGALTGTSATFSSIVTATAPSSGIAFQVNGRSSDNIGQILFYANNGTTLQNYLQSRPAYFSINTETNTPIYLNTNVGGAGGTVMTLTGGGNVGIGTTAPSGKLEVVPENINGNEGIFVNQLGSRQSTIRFKSAHDANSDYRIGASIIVGSAFEIYSVAAATSRLVITSGGTVLIGGTTDSGNGQKLQVTGSASTTGGIYSYGGILGSIGTASNSIGSGPYVAIVNSSNSFQVLQQLNTSYGIDYWVYTGGWTKVMTISSAGSITATSFFESSDKTIKTLIEDNCQTKGIESVTAKLYLKNGVEELGYFAQDVQGILPSAVNKGADGLLNLSYREVHTAKIARLEKEIEELKAKLN